MNVGLASCRILPEPDPDAELLVDAVARQGIQAEYVPWDAPDFDGTRFDLLVLRSCWNYHLEPGEFRRWLGLAESQCRMLNPPDVVRWNMDKRYLLDLEKSGLPIVPTAYLGDVDALCPVMEERQWSKFVLKPTISAGSWRTRVFDEVTDDCLAFLSTVLEDREAMVQPFLSSVKTVGERSVMAIGGEATHAVVKHPRLDGDHESVVLGDPPTSLEKELLERALSAVEGDTLYARLDLIQDERGEWLVSELELIEPSLFFSQWPESGDRFAAALRGVLIET